MLGYNRVLKNLFDHPIFNCSPSHLSLVKPGRGRQARERPWPGRWKRSYLWDTLRLPAKALRPSTQPIFNQPDRRVGNVKGWRGLSILLVIGVLSVSCQSIQDILGP
jgi:hypothetical protein